MQAQLLITCAVVSCLLFGTAAQRRTFAYERKPTMFDALANMANNGGFGGSVGVTRNGGSNGNGGLTGDMASRRNIGIVSNGGGNGNEALANALRLANTGVMNGNGAALQNLFNQPTEVPDCPLEIHPDTESMFIMRSPLGDPEPRTCPPGTYFLRSVCSCVNRPLDSKECNLRPSAIGQGWYEENVFGVWVQRPCGPGSAYNPTTCDCSLTL
ncbi:uncharacterized protein LOC132730190 [Ruditapes philippinarum]|uniref:uncharacterized protein LOC132730190 n=1 Tax=Ruditapes philippinarum TaxID=129788 RepID=UPI00295BC3A3|nr:uncharacterized protein LOC132730190 [Ruditapes philippinarum]